MKTVAASFAAESTLILWASPTLREQRTPVAGAQLKCPRVLEKLAAVELFVEVALMVHVFLVVVVLSASAGSLQVQVLWVSVGLYAQTETCLRSLTMSVPVSAATVMVPPIQAQRIWRSLWVWSAAVSAKRS